MPGFNSIVLIVVLSITCVSSALGANYTRSTKRGLVFVPNAATPSDNSIWVENQSDLSWYYNYGPAPSSVYSSVSSLQFVPMLWGAPATVTTVADTTFLDTVKSLISAGMNITYVLSFNEPDGSIATGGSNITPELAAAIWIRELEPLRKLGVKLAAPATTGSNGGFTWLTSFFAACNGSCTADIMPVHWYGDFQGLASHIGQKRAAYPNMTMWVTEFALNNASLSETQAFFNTSLEYLDRLDYITHYSWFGSFRSSKSNVGPNAAFLTADGKLTDIGSWYLGGASTNNIPRINTSTLNRAGKLSSLTLGIFLLLVWC